MSVLFQPNKSLFNDIPVNIFKKLVAAPDFQHILNDTIISLFQFSCDIFNLIFDINIPRPIQLQFLNHLQPFFNINLTHLTKNLQRFIIHHNWLQENVHPIVKNLNANL